MDCVELTSEQLRRKNSTGLSQVGSDVLAIFDSLFDG